MTNPTTASEQTVALSVVYRGWDDFQNELMKVITPLTAEQLALPVAPHHWRIGLAVQHIVMDRSWWFHLWMGEGGPEMAQYMNWDGEDQPVRSPAELRAGLEATWAMIESALNSHTVADLKDVFFPEAQLTERERAVFGPITRQEIIWHVYGHERNHGGEIAAGLGWHNLPTLSGW